MNHGIEQVFVNMPYVVNMVSVNNIGPYQPAQTMQADIGQHFLQMG